MRLAAVGALERVVFYAHRGGAPLTPKATRLSVSIAQSTPGETTEKRMRMFEGRVVSWFGEGKVARVEFDSLETSARLVALSDDAVTVVATDELSSAKTNGFASTRELLPAALIADVMCALAKQGVEKIDSVRNCAGALLQRIVVETSSLGDKGEEAGLEIPHLTELSAIIPPLLDADGE